jgi:uncharacterized protein (TIGR03435 family)
MGRVSFEVASIKPTADAGNHRPVRFAVSPAGKLSVANMPLRWLIANAWDVPFQSKRLAGGPAWVHNEPYDIEAIAPAMFAPGISASEREARTRVLLRALLAQRFGLVVREELRDLPVYALVQTKRGHKLSHAVIQEKDCPVNPSDDGLYCHHLQGGMRDGLRGQAVDMNDVAMQAEDWLDRPVVDETGIAGLYKVRTEGWGAPEDTEKPSVFRVFEETLGLKLEPKRAKIKVYVIEKVDRPSPN